MLALLLCKEGFMKFHQIKRRYITLIEIMIVMFLIALIAGVITYNYRGSLDEGKAFKTKTAIDKIETILNLSVAEDPGLLDHIETEWKKVIRTSPLVKNADELSKDGWGNEFQVTNEGNVIQVHSAKYDEYKENNATLFRK
jgi:type II secretory pathway pseudopilin PulG